MQSKSLALAALVLALVLSASPAVAAEVSYFDVPQGDHPHDVAPAPDGTVWYTGQRAGVLGHLNPDTGEVERIPVGEGSAPHGVIIGPDGAAWLTDGGLNAIVRVDPVTHETLEEFRAPYPQTALLLIRPTMSRLEGGAMTYVVSEPA